ncbi:MAG: glycosyltransferase, partial [Bacteroidales bacterium]|nr:glycosyltransferase [Bacteroidales bacterium]
IKYSSTVSQSVANAYYEGYGIRMECIRNLPFCDRKEVRRQDILVSGPNRIIIYQGALNVGRGLERMIEAMQYLDAFHFQIFGDGDIAGQLVVLSKELKVEDRVEFMGRLPFQELKPYTRQASLGISLEEDMGLNYRYALPNKLFDYIQSRIPVLVSDLPEMRKVVEQYDIGQILRDTDPEMLAKQVKEMMESDELRMIWKKNLYKAASELCWEKEEEKFRMLYLKALNL